MGIKRGYSHRPLGKVGSYPRVPKSEKKTRLEKKELEKRNQSPRRKKGEKYKNGH